FGGQDRIISDSASDYASNESDAMQIGAEGASSPSGSVDHVVDGEQGPSRPPSGGRRAARPMLIWPRPREPDRRCEMTDVLPVLRDIASSLVLLLGTQTLTATLLLLGAATLVAAVAAATARWGTPLVVGTAARPVD